jgi:hypothetical protein
MEEEAVSVYAWGKEETESGEGEVPFLLRRGATSSLFSPPLARMALQRGWKPMLRKATVHYRARWELS